MKRTLVILALTAAPALAQEAHVHGVSTLRITAEGDRLQVLLHSPGADIVGFEHEATGQADLAAVADALHVLSDPARVIGLDASAECVLVEAQSALEADEDKHAHDSADHHSAFETRFDFECGNVGALEHLTLPFFDSFPAAQEVEVEYLTGAIAGAKEIRRDQPELTLD